MRRVVVVDGAASMAALSLAAACERMELVAAIDELPPTMRAVLDFMDMPPEMKARRNAEMRQRIADAEARAKTYRTEQPQGRAAQRRLRQIAKRAKEPA